MSDNKDNATQSSTPTKNKFYKKIAYILLGAGIGFYPFNLLRKGFDDKLKYGDFISSVSSFCKSTEMYEPEYYNANYVDWMKTKNLGELFTETEVEGKFQTKNRCIIKKMKIIKNKKDIIDVRDIEKYSIEGLNTNIPNTNLDVDVNESRIFIRLNTMNNNLPMEYNIVIYTNSSIKDLIIKDDKYEICRIEVAKGASNNLLRECGDNEINHARKVLETIIIGN